MSLTPLWAEVFTHDLDFGALLAATSAEGPSVIQVRTQDVTLQHLEGIITGALRQHAKLLEGGELKSCAAIAAYGSDGRDRDQVLPIVNQRNICVVEPGLFELMANVPRRDRRRLENLTERRPTWAWSRSSFQKACW